MASVFRAAPVGLAQGYDSFRGEGRNTALTVTSSELFGGESSVRYRVCESTQEVMEELEIDQSLSLGFFGVVSVNQKLQFVDRQRMSTHSVSIVVYSKHTEGTEKVTNVALRDEVPHTNAELRDFFQVYGDSYLVSRTTGAEYAAIYTYHSSTQEQQRQLTAEMEVAGIFKAFVGDVGLQVKINNFQSSQNMNISFEQIVMGKHPPNGLPAPDSILEFALSFSSLPLTSPIITDIRTLGYECVPRIGSRFNTIARNVRKLSRANFVADLFHVHELHNSVSTIVDTYKFYSGSVDDRLQQLHEHVVADERAIAGMIEEFEADPSSPIVLNLRSIGYGVPALAFVTREVGNVTNIADDAFEEDARNDNGGDVQAFLQQLSKITAIQMQTIEWGGARDECVNLMVTYRKQQGRSAPEYWTVNHGAAIGGNGIIAGPLSRVLPVPADQFVTIFRGELREILISQLTVELSNGQTLAAGGRQAPFRKFNVPTPDGFFLLSFYSASLCPNSPLDIALLKLVFCSLLPCVWR